MMKTTFCSLVCSKFAKNKKPNNSTSTVLLINRDCNLFARWFNALQLKLDYSLGIHCLSVVFECTVFIINEGWRKPHNLLSLILFHLNNKVTGRIKYSPVKFFFLCSFFFFKLGKGKEVRDLKPSWRATWEILLRSRHIPMPYCSRS